MNKTHLFQLYLMILACLSTALLLSGKFGVVQPWQLRYAAVTHGVICGALLMYSLVLLGWVPRP